MKTIKAILKGFFSKDATDGWPLPIWFRSFLYFVGLIYLGNYGGHRLSVGAAFIVVLYFVIGLPYYVYELREKIREYRKEKDRARETGDIYTDVIEELVADGLILPRGKAKLRKAGLIYPGWRIDDETS